MSKEFISPIRVYIEDTDTGGIVYYVNYLKFMERSRTELFRTLGFERPALLTDGLLLVVASANVVYKKPARLDDQLNVSTRLLKLARTYVVFEQNVYCNGEILCEGQIKVACVSKDVMKPAVIPDNVRKAFQLYSSSLGD